MLPDYQAMITSPTNEKVKYLRSLAEKKFRQQEGCFLIEGVRLVEEALKTGTRLRLVLYEPDLLNRTPRGRRILGELPPDISFSATEKVIKAASQTVTPQGIVAAVEFPRVESKDEGQVILVLDSLSDPGNLGTILRTSEAAGVSTVVTTEETVDPFNPKVVRSAMGAHLRLRLLDGLDWGKVREISGNRQILLAEASGGKAYYKINWTLPTVLIVGSEAHGASPEAEQLATELVSIPMPGNVESLNVAVATGVLLFEALRQISEKGNDEESKQGETHQGLKVGD